MWTHNLGMLYRWMGSHGLARDALRQSLDVDPAAHGVFVRHRTAVAEKVKAATH